MTTTRQPTPDPRWAYTVGGVDDAGQLRPMSFAVLADLAAQWEEIVEPQAPPYDGPVVLLRTARSLFAHAWFDYEFMAVASLVAFQAMEAAFRLLYPDDARLPARRLLRRANEAGIVSDKVAAVADAGFDLRNQFSHPATQDALTVGMACSMLENTHRLVAVVLSIAVARS